VLFEWRELTALSCDRVVHAQDRAPLVREASRTESAVRTQKWRIGILNGPSALSAVHVTKIVSKPPTERDAESASQPGFAAGFNAPTRPMGASGLTARCTARCSREKHEPFDDRH
jgi:hypothetical protein